MPASVSLKICCVGNSTKRKDHLFGSTKMHQQSRSTSCRVNLNRHAAWSESFQHVVTELSRHAKHHNFYLFFKFSCFVNKPLSPTSFALLDTTTGQMGNTIYLFFLHKIKLIPSLPPISHLSGITFPWYSLGTRTKGRPPYSRLIIRCLVTVTTGKMGKLYSVG